MRDAPMWRWPWTVKIQTGEATVETRQLLRKKYGVEGLRNTFLYALDHGITPHQVNQLRQNRLRYLVRDFAILGIDPEHTKVLLLGRGVNKWFSNRLKFIALNHDLKRQVTILLSEIVEAKKNRDWKRRERLVGRLEGIELVRRDINAICKSSRWVFPK